MNDKKYPMTLKEFENRLFELFIERGNDKKDWHYFTDIKYNPFNEKNESYIDTWYPQYCKFYNEGYNIFDDKYLIEDIKKIEPNIFKDKFTNYPLSLEGFKEKITYLFIYEEGGSEEELNAAFKENTKCVLTESISNPNCTVLDFEKFAKVAHEHGVPLIVDNTFPTPINCRPIEWGADIVTHSTTKYMDGHGAAVGGAIVDSGNFDWMAHADKFPGLCTPDDSYHGITYAEKFGKEGAFITKATVQLMRDFGCIQSPQHAFILNLGL